MLYCHKHCYIAKGTWAIVIEICSFVLMVIVSTRHMSSHALAAHHTKQSLSLAHRCCVHYVSLVALMLFIHHYTYSFMLCSYHRFAQLLYFLRRSYFERSPGILCFYSVFFTIPCIFWHHSRRRELCCILHNNISILSSLTTSLMCWLLQHYLHPFLHVPFSKKHSAPISLCSKLTKNRLYSTLFLSHLYPAWVSHGTKNTPLFAVYMCYPYLLTFACQRDESGSHELSGHYFLRSRYSPLAVSTEITSPVLIKAGTLTTRPVSSVASLSTLLVVSPFTTSSV